MKNLFSILLISFLFNQPLLAGTKYYQYNGDLPFIEMMLNMMTSMGMIDKIPPQFIGRSYYNNPYMTHPYANQQAFNAPYMMQENNPDTTRKPSEELTHQQSPCEGDNCVKNNPVQLNGLWLTPHGEMLGIKNQQFLWSDGASRYLIGYVKAREDVFSLKVKSNGMVINYQYKLDNNRLQTRDSKGVIRSFIKAPMR